MTNARYRRKQLAKRDGALVPLPTQAPEPGAEGPAPSPGPAPTPASAHDPDAR